MPSIQQPFVVGKPVSGKYFIDREAELRKIAALLSGTAKGNINNIILLGLRRTGKSSILLNVKDNFYKNQKIIPVIFDAYGISTKDRFSRSFIDAILAAYIEKSGDNLYKQKIRQIISQGYEKIKDKLSEFDIEVAELVKFHASLREAGTKDDELLEHALEYPEKLGVHKNISFVIMIDEFQELLKWGDEFLRMFRRLVQAQHHVAYVFTGSAPTVMKEMVYDAKSPFYKQLIDVHVALLPHESVSLFVRKRLKTVGIEMDSNALDRIYQLSRGFADYVQRLGLQIYLDCLENNKQSVTASEVESAYSEMIVKLDPDFNNQFATFSDLEKEILISLAKSINSYAAIATEIRKPVTTIPKTMTRLINQDIVERYIEGKYRITDAVFADWLAKRYSSLAL